MYLVFSTQVTSHTSHAQCFFVFFTILTFYILSLSQHFKYILHTMFTSLPFLHCAIVTLSASASQPCWFILYYIHLIIIIYCIKLNLALKCFRHIHVYIQFYLLKSIALSFICHYCVFWHVYIYIYFVVVIQCGQAETIGTHTTHAMLVLRMSPCFGLCLLRLLSCCAGCLLLPPSGYSVTGNLAQPISEYEVFFVDLSDHSPHMPPLLTYTYWSYYLFCR